MAESRVYADFQNLDDVNRLRLTCAGTLEDLNRQGIQLHEGLVLTFYMDDADDEGRPDQLLADGVVTYNATENCWVADVDWSSLYHASEDQVSSDSRAGKANNGVGVSTIDSDTWPEFVYRYVEHYFWQPQHLGARRVGQPPGRMTVERFYKTIRSQEVPLAFLFRLFLRLSPTGFRQACMEPFQPRIGREAWGPLRVTNEKDEEFARADICLESPSARVFIEVKVRARLSLEQVHKYILLHALHAEKDEKPKQPYLFFLTKRPFNESWDTVQQDGKAESQDPDSLLRTRLGKECFSEKLLRKPIVPHLLSRYQDVCAKLVFGEARWQQLGDVIAREKELLSSQGGELGEVVQTLAGDFLHELNRRSLWRTMHSR